MKTSIVSAFFISLVVLTGCVTVNEDNKAKPPAQNTQKPGPETVLVTYHVQLGREAQLETVLAQAWKAYRKEDMVLASPHIIVREGEAGGQTRYVEIFTWAKPPNNPSATVRGFWQEEHGLCEARNGGTDIEGGPVQLVTGK